MSHYSIGNVVRSALWGVLVGGAAGFTLGLLLAPEEGSKTRRRLAFRLENLANQVSDLVDTYTRPTRDSAARREGDAVVADAKSRAKQIGDDIDALLGEMRQSSNS